jgi:hypothetical protein
MDEFRSIGNAAMSSDETPKIEPKIEPVLTITDAPPIVASVEPAKPESELKIEPKLEPKADIPTPEIPKAETLPEAPKLEKIEAKAEPKAEPKVETKTEFPKFELSASQAPNASAAPKITASATVIPLKKPEPAAAPAPQSRNTRFALLAACVAVAASFGAVGGSLGVAKFGPVISSAPVPAAPIAKEQIADEVKALKDTVAQLRATTNKLSDNFAALKTTVTTASAQNGKIAEALDRIEKSQAEQRKAATAAAAPAVSTTEVTGSIAQKQAAAPAVPMVLGTPPTTLKPPAVPGFVLRRVYDGAALIEGRDGMIEVEPGMVAPGLGRVEAIKREDGRWVVVTARGIVR